MLIFDENYVICIDSDGGSGSLCVSSRRSATLIDIDGNRPRIVTIPSARRQNECGWHLIDRSFAICADRFRDFERNEEKNCRSQAIMVANECVCD